MTAVKNSRLAFQNYRFLAEIEKSLLSSLVDGVIRVTLVTDKVRYLDYDYLAVNSVYYLRIFREADIADWGWMDCQCTLQI